MPEHPTPPAHNEASVPPCEKPTAALPGLFFGSYGTALGFTGPRLCVLEEPASYPALGQDAWIPVLRRDEAGNTYADNAALERAADWIEDNLRTAGWAMVHCLGGIERSPFVIAYFLVHKIGRTWDEAYKQLISARRGVQRRDAEWMVQSADARRNTRSRLGGVR